MTVHPYYILTSSLCVQRILTQSMQAFLNSEVLSKHICTKLVGMQYRHVAQLESDANTTDIYLSCT